MEGRAFFCVVGWAWLVNEGRGTRTTKHACETQARAETYSFSDPFFKAFCKMALDKLEENKDEISDIKEIVLRDLLEKMRIEIKS